jgi:hypothetical protein
MVPYIKYPNIKPGKKEKTTVVNPVKYARKYIPEKTTVAKIILGIGGINKRCLSLGY